MNRATPKFQRKIEDFTCGNCRFSVKGNGYTNHCPKCLWSKHVDVNPGDRQAECRGMMKPVELSIVGGEQVITHECIKCGFKKNNMISPQDDQEAIVSLSVRRK